MTIRENMLDVRNRLNDIHSALSANDLAPAGLVHSLECDIDKIDRLYKFVTPHGIPRYRDAKLLELPSNVLEK